jgi:hypothetical protein
MVLNGHKLQNARHRLSDVSITRRWGDVGHAFTDKSKTAVHDGWHYLLSCVDNDGYNTFRHMYHIRKLCYASP